MKILSSLLSVFVVATMIITGCSKSSNNNIPVERKKYAWVVGDQDSTGYGMILFSADGGVTWVRQGQGSAALQGIDVVDVFALDENNVWAISSLNVILRTLNGGQTWSRIPGPVHPSYPELMAISIVNHTNLWISGSNGAVYNSIDGGNNWIMFDTTYFHRGGMQGIRAINPQVVYVVGGYGGGTERGFIARTMDGGASWDSITLTDDYNKHEWISVAATDLDHVVVYGVTTHYAYTTNSGTTWINDSLEVGGGGGGADINHLIMLDDQTWWAALDMGHIYLTEDGAASWISQTITPSQGGMFLVGIDAYDRQLALSVGLISGYPPAGSIVRTSDGGNVWEVTYTCKSSLSKVSFIK
ncbi:MAG: YCF48-related protein [bacterium]